MEVIVVDDFSCDEETEIAIKELENEFERCAFRVIRLSKNCGPSVARNRAWDAARQPLVAFLDADDAWHPRKIELQIPLMMGPGSATISCHGSCVASENSAISMDFYSEPVAANEISLRQMLNRNRLATSTVMIRKSIAHRFDPNKRYSEDYELWLRIMFDGALCVRLPLPLTTYFKHAFGAGGLSGDLLAMQRGQNSVYRGLFFERRISLATYAVLRTWAAIRFARRLAIVGLRRLRRMS